MNLPVNLVARKMCPAERYTGEARVSLRKKNGQHERSRSIFWVCQMLQLRLLFVNTNLIDVQFFREVAQHDTRR
jgi:hypothetical protein